MFTKENISSLPVPDAKFQEPKFDYLEPLIVTLQKIKAMKDNKSPGVDGIPLKLLMETVQNLYTPCKSVQIIIKRGSCSF